MKTTYSYKFIHHTHLVTNDYKFIVYLAHCPGMYDIIHEFDGLEAFNHYQEVQNTTPEELQYYLHIISHPNSDNICPRLTDKSTQVQRLPNQARSLYPKTIAI
jgi:hypothetical protein